MFKRLSIYSVVLLVGFSAVAQPLTTNLTPENAVTTALADNRDLMAARFAIQQAEGRLKQAGLWPNPEFELGRQNDRAFANDGEYNLSTGFKQRFPITGRLSKAKAVGRVDVAQAMAEVRNQERLLAGEVLGLSRELLVTQEKLKANQEIQTTIQKLLDVCTPAEHAEIHVPEVQLAPLDRLDATQFASANGFAKYQPFYIFCRTGNRAKLAAEKLKKTGYSQCHVVEGGTMAWVQAGLPVTRGTSKVISLERQVRIAAGAIVLIRVLLAQFVNPAFIWLSGFVGAGLAFAGISDWCGMGMLIAKMPWNQRGSGSCCTK